MIRMSRPSDTGLLIKDSQVSQPGIQEHGNGTAPARNERYIAVRRPGGRPTTETAATARHTRPG